MNDHKKKFFEDLAKDREESANMLEKPSMKGVQRTVVEKYSDQAHFIYELLQNADDVEATKVTFNLYNDKLVFIHNGKRKFSVSNPLTEKEDSEKGKLGDINSITSIASSSSLLGNGSFWKRRRHIKSIEIHSGKRWFFHMW